MICEELIRRKDEAKQNGINRSIVDKTNQEASLCYELANEIDLKCGYVENIWHYRDLR